MAALLTSVIARESPTVQQGYREGKKGEVNAAFAKGSLEHTADFAFRQCDIFEEALRWLRDRAGASAAALVFENLEQILDQPELLRELTSMLLLVDDSSYAKFRVKILLVTTASDVRSYLATTAKSNTITNRITEIPEGARLAIPQAQAFVRRGFFDLLKFTLSNDLKVEELMEWVLRYSDRIPQFLHELCLEIASHGERSGRALTRDHLLEGTLQWVRSSLIREVSVVEANLNSRSTQIGRKNQVVFALGQCPDQDFDHGKIERIVRKEFPQTSSNVGLNISQTLSQLAESQHPLIRRVPGGSAFRFIDPKLRIVVRWKLAKEAVTERLRLRDFGEAISL